MRNTLFVLILLSVSISITVSDTINLLVPLTERFPCETLCPAERKVKCSARVNREKEMWEVRCTNDI
ncbi:hypothetical protein AB6A40_000046 [Gnathostoma spinigerum]|uniref:Uncharacterized protein n=1 Tax=Gnathostoma spinigerum TaxID=75299 RepID=A0ABD6E9I2_9BILA